MAQVRSEYIEDGAPGVTLSLRRDIFATKDETAVMRRDIERFISQPAVREAIENHKSNWVPNSKGGEPNCRRL